MAIENEKENRKSDGKKKSEHISDYSKCEWLKFNS